MIFSCSSLGDNVSETSATAWLRCTAALLNEIKERVRTAQLRAALAVNRELIPLYWSIGWDISSRFDTEGWGTKVIDRLAKDLGTEFPGVEGFRAVP